VKNRLRIEELIGAQLVGFAETNGARALVLCFDRGFIALDVKLDPYGEADAHMDLDAEIDWELFGPVPLAKAGIGELEELTTKCAEVAALSKQTERDALVSRAQLSMAQLQRLHPEEFTQLLAKLGGKV